jgi:4-hydroxybenzoate polyprenyltransferase
MSGTVQPHEVYAIIIVLVAVAGAILYFLGKNNDKRG